MKFILNAVATLLITVVATALAVIFQNDIASFLGRSPVKIAYEVSKFYPYPVSKPKDKYPHENTYSDVTSFHVSIINTSGTDIKSVVLYTELDFGDFDVVTVRDGVASNFRKDIRRYNAGTIRSGEKLDIYAWSETAFERFSADKTFLITDHGKVGFDLYDVPISTEIGSVDFSWESIGYILFILTAISSFILTFISYAYESYCKHLLADEDFYLSESVRFLRAPKKLSPSNPPQSTQAKLKVLQETI